MSQSSFTVDVLEADTGCSRQRPVNSAGSEKRLTVDKHHGGGNAASSQRRRPQAWVCEVYPRLQESESCRRERSRVRRWGPWPGHEIRAQTGFVLRPSISALQL